LTASDDINVTQPFLRFAWENLSPRDRIRILADAPKTLWLFGAGASHHYNLNARGVPVPLANRFFEAFHDLPTSSGFNAHVGPLVSHLQEYRGIRPDKVHEFHENIEAFMTSLENELIQIKARGEETSKEDFPKALSLAMAMNNMTFILANVINEAQNGPTETLYAYLLGFCSPNDIFVTFNWDTLLDRALASSGGWSPNDGYCLSFSGALDGEWRKAAHGKRAFKTNWKLIKLHGSTNWLVPYSYINFQSLEYSRFVPKSDRIFLYWQSTLPFATHRSRWRGGYAPTCYGYYPPNIPGAYFERSHLALEPGRALLQINPLGVFSPFKEPSARGIPSSPLLITPVRQKHYEDYVNSIETLWRTAESEFRDVKRIVIIGYSFPETDTRPLRTMREALSQNKGRIEVHIVAPDADQIASRIGDEHFKHACVLTLHKGKFEDFISFLTEGTPDIMKRAAAEGSEVDEWLKRLFVMHGIAMAGGIRQLRDTKLPQQGEPPNEPTALDE
jgi:hypothetical protein